MRNDDDHSQEYEVGYGRPPKRTQFPKGVSGNPRGRPKGAKKLTAIVNEVLQEKVLITVNGQRKKVTKIKAALMQMANKAASGDLLAMRQLTPLAGAAEIEDGESKKSNDSETDRRLMARLIERIQKSHKGENE
jgi:Family of unknown function (DUF5681)